MGPHGCLRWMLCMLLYACIEPSLECFCAHAQLYIPGPSDVLS